MQNLLGVALRCKYTLHKVGLVSFPLSHKGRARAAAGAPLELTEDLLTTFNIACVVRGTTTETGASGAALAERRYAAARARGIFQCACRCHSHQRVAAGMLPLGSMPCSAPGQWLPCKRDRGSIFQRNLNLSQMCCFAACQVHFVGSVG